jgi:hypothetical protein
MIFLILVLFLVLICIRRCQGIAAAPLLAAHFLIPQ